MLALHIHFPMTVTWTLYIESYYKNCIFLNMPAKTVLKNLPLRLGNPWKNIAASKISKNSSYLSAIFEKQVFPKTPHKGHFWNVTKYAVFQ